MNLALYFSKSVSLSLWLEKGLFDREKLIYEHHLKSGVLNYVVWITYGKKDTEIANALYKSKRLNPSIRVINKPFIFPDNWFGDTLYSFFSPFLLYSTIKKVHIIKTNQLDCGWGPILSSAITRNQLLLRCGYVRSKLREAIGISKVRLKLMRTSEYILCKYANLITVSSEHDAAYISSNYRIETSKIFVIPNYIDTLQFKPLGKTCPEKNNKLLFVGRLNKQKNLRNLIKAAAYLNLELDIVGTGELLEELKSISKRIGAKVCFLKEVSNSNIPSMMNQYNYYILPSYVEGMPKSLLEAMSCGLVCIGTNVSGINEVINDNVNGFLAFDTDSTSIVVAIKNAFQSDKNIIGENARKTILSKHSLDTVSLNESQIFELLSEKRRRLQSRGATLFRDS